MELTNGSSDVKAGKGAKDWTGDGRKMAVDWDGDLLSPDGWRCKGGTGTAMTPAILVSSLARSHVRHFSGELQRGAANDSRSR